MLKGLDSVVQSYIKSLSNREEVVNTAIANAISSTA